MKKHVTLVGALHIGYGGLQVLGAAMAFLFIVGGGLLGARLSEEPWVLGITAFVGTAIAVWVTLLSVPGIVGGIVLLRHKPWARIVVLVVSALMLANFPLGTGIGAYSLWVLLQQETEKLFGACC